MLRWANLAHRFRIVDSPFKRRCSSSKNLYIEDDLREFFDKFKPNEHTPLFRDFDTYTRTLPVRQRGNHFLKLFELPYFGADEDLKAMANHLDEKEGGERKVLKYISAPPASGKTMGMLPACLKSNKTHYLYLAFSNNNNRNFVFNSSFEYLLSLRGLKTENREEVLKRLGAQFVIKCVKTLLEEPEKEGPFMFQADDKLPPWEDSVNQLKQLIDYNFSPQTREQDTILFHVDEHKKMCERSNDENDPGAIFRRGALQALAQVGTVAATYVDPLYDVETIKSSSAIRKAMGLARPDFNLVLQHVDLRELIDNLKVDGEEERLVKMLHFRLAVMFQPNPTGQRHRMEMGGFHEVENSPRLPEIQDLIDILRETLQNEGGGGAKEVLEQCINHCPSPPFPGQTGRAYAAELLVGMSDQEVEDAVEKVGSSGISNLLSLKSRQLSMPLLELLTSEDQDSRLNAVYMKGCRRFKDVFKKTDLLSADPLEDAYIWALSCRSATVSEIQFHEDFNFDICCTDIQPGRIFPGQDPKNFEDIDKVGKNIIHYADEKGRERDGSKLTHPRVDIFFRTNDDKLVLIDVAGSANPKRINDKAKNLSNTIKEMQKNRYQLYKKPVGDWTTEDICQCATEKADFDEEDADKLAKQKITGPELANLTKEDIRSFGIPYGPAAKLEQVTQALWTRNEVYGVVLAPAAADVKDPHVDGNTLTLRGENARFFLGGLDQILGSYTSST